MKHFIFAILLVALLPSAGSAQESKQIVVNLTGIDVPQTGRIVFLLFNRAEGFPIAPERAYRKGILNDFSTTVTYTFNEVPAGTYAVAVFHDENSNGEIDRNFAGMPKESVGASNMTGFGKPNFTKCMFTKGTTQKVIDLQFIN